MKMVVGAGPPPHPANDPPAPAKFLHTAGGGREGARRRPAVITMGGAIVARGNSQFVTAGNTRSAQTVRSA